MKKIRIKATALFLILCTVFTMLSGLNVAAEDYRYDEFEDTIPAQSAYVAKKNYNGEQLEVGSFSSPTDLFVYDDSLIYVLDAGNNRIVVLDGDMTAQKILTIQDETGEEVSISGAQGLFVSEEKIYIADSAQSRLLITDLQGVVTNIITRPDSVLFTTDVSYTPRNVVLDKSGTIYLISSNSTQGAYMLNEDGEFLGFYGRNSVDVTASVVFQAFVREFVSDSMRSLMSNFIPVEFANFDVDENGFIYTVTAYSSTPKTASMIKKLNPLGENILSNEYRTWGDEGGTTSYVDVAVDGDGFIYALDSYTGRIFMYDNTGYQIAIFGGNGSTVSVSGQLGTFVSAHAVDTLGDQVLVLDSSKNTITVFDRTEFGTLLAEGLGLYNDGRMEEALPYFEELVRMDANFTYAYSIMAEAYYDMENYTDALSYAKLSQLSTETYSKAKKMLRNDMLRENFALLFFSIIVLCFVAMAVSKVVRVKRKEKNLAVLTSGERQADGFYMRMAKWKYPFYILRHPVDGLNELKNNKKYSLLSANLILLAWVLLAILNWGYIDYDFRSNFQDVSLIQVLLTTIIVFAVAVIANWCFTTLMDGKGKFPEIWVVGAYALLPYVLCGYLRVILSYALVYDEAVFLTYLIAIAGIWSFLLLMLGLSVLHDYSVYKTVGSLLLTVVGVLIVLFFAVLLSGLAVQIYSFFMTIYSEIRYRFL